MPFISFTALKAVHWDKLPLGLVMNSVRNSLLPILVILLSLALLIPGVTQPILSLNGSIDKAKLTEQGIEQVAQSFDEDSGRDSARGM